MSLRLCGFYLFSGASAFSVCSAVKFENFAISLENSTVPVDIGNWTFESNHGTAAIDWVVEGTTLYPVPIIPIPLFIGGLTIAKKR